MRCDAAFPLPAPSPPLIEFVLNDWVVREELDNLLGSSRAGPCRRLENDEDAGVRLGDSPETGPPAPSIMEEPEVSRVVGDEDTVPCGGGGHMLVIARMGEPDVACRQYVVAGLTEQLYEISGDILVKIEWRDDHL